MQLIKIARWNSKGFSGGRKRVKILKHDEKTKEFLTCEVEIINDQNVTKDLEQFAIGLIKKFERLQILSKKDLNDGSNNLKNLKRPFSNCKSYFF